MSSQSAPLNAAPAEGAASGVPVPAPGALTPGTRITYLVLLALALAAPMIGLYPVFVMKLLCFALFACAFNLLLGFTGLLSFGHAAFFGMAAYIAGWFVKEQGWTPLLGIVVGTATGAALGLVFGLVAIRRQGIYFAMITLTYGAGVALAALAGVLAAPVVQVRPVMGSSLIIVVFAVVVIGGMGSILGSVITGLLLGVVEGLTRVFYPEASNVVVFVIMVIVLMVRPAGLFGKEA